MLKLLCMLLIVSASSSISKLSENFESDLKRHLLDVTTNYLFEKAFTCEDRLKICNYAEGLQYHSCWKNHNYENGVFSKTIDVQCAGAPYSCADLQGLEMDSSKCDINPNLAKGGCKHECGANGEPLLVCAFSVDSDNTYNLRSDNTTCHWNLVGCSGNGQSQHELVCFSSSMWQLEDVASLGVSYEVHAAYRSFAHPIWWVPLLLLCVFLVAMSALSVTAMRFRDANLKTAKQRKHRCKQIELDNETPMSRNNLHEMGVYIPRDAAELLASLSPLTVSPVLLAPQPKKQTKMHLRVQVPKREFGGPKTQELEVKKQFEQVQVLGAHCPSSNSMDYSDTNLCSAKDCFGSPGSLEYREKKFSRATRLGNPLEASEETFNDNSLEQILFSPVLLISPQKPVQKYTDKQAKKLKPPQSKQDMKQDFETEDKPSRLPASKSRHFDRSGSRQMSLPMAAQMPSLGSQTTEGWMKPPLFSNIRLRSDQRRCTDSHLMQQAVNKLAAEQSPAGEIIRGEAPIDRPPLAHQKSISKNSRGDSRPMQVLQDETAFTSCDYGLDLGGGLTVSVGGSLGQPIIRSGNSLRSSRPASASNSKKVSKNASLTDFHKRSLNNLEELAAITATRR
eukprot:Platyproteum_vivax@DN6431_c0_g1_i2.p1